MKRWLALALLFFAALPEVFAEMGVSVSVGQPGFYGMIELGNAPMPQLIYSRPLMVQPVPYGVVLPPPVYLRVPPGYAQRWRWHCQEFNACGRPVYFVQDGWYNRIYVPFYRGHGEGWGRGGERGGFRGEGEQRRAEGEHRGHEGRD